MVTSQGVAGNANKWIPTDPSRLVHALLSRFWGSWVTAKSVYCGYLYLVTMRLLQVAGGRCREVALSYCTSRWGPL